MEHEIKQQPAAADYAILMLAGTPPQKQAARLLTRLAPGAACIVAADGGAEHLAALGLLPQIILGDGDSLRHRFPDIPRETYPVAKDFSDGEAALLWCQQHCSGPIYIFGGLGGRLDHQLTNLLMPLNLCREPQRVVFFDDACRVSYSLGAASISGCPGDTVSLIPLTPVHGLTLSGFVYPLENGDICPGTSRTISNLLSGRQASLQHRDGSLLIVQQLLEPDTERLPE